MSNKKGTPYFKGNVCNCSLDDQTSLGEAAKVQCYPVKDRIQGDHSNLEFIHKLRAQ